MKVHRMYQRINRTDPPSKHRDWLRTAARAVGLEELVAPLDAFDELTRWALSLPWTIELPATLSDPQIRRFAIDCAPLDWQAVWLLIGDFNDPALPDQVHIALPDAMASLAVAVGWATPVVDMIDGRLLVGVPTPMTGTELRALEDVLGIAHQCAFPPADQLLLP
jgi:hypothetical protein